MHFLRLPIFTILFSITFTQDVYEGYILFTPGGIGNANTTFLKDIDGSNINTWSHSNGPASMPYLLQGDEPGFENTLLYYPCRSNNPTMESGGVGGRVDIYNWEGELLYRYDISSTINQHHHDITVLPNGNFVVIAWERLYSSEWQDLGRSSVNNSLNQMWMLAFYEIEPTLDGRTESINNFDSVVWEWHIKDHLVQDRGPQYSATYGQPSEYPELMDINCGDAGSNGGPGGNANGDWMHVNAIDYNEELDQIVFSSRYQNEIYIIDHSTTTEEAASHSGGNSGKGGDFLYRWGNPSNYGRGNSSDEILGGQHSVNWIKEGYPGEGNLILFNNRQSNSQSAALEFIPPIDVDGNYIINDNQPFGPDSWEWLYQGGAFFSDVQSGAFRLPNGNTIITDANDGYIFEVTLNGDIVWEYTYPGNNILVARAEKYGYNYFDNTNISGDINDDGIVNILDIISVVNIVLGAEQNEAADVNSDGLVNILDIVSIVNIILGG